MSPAPVDVAVVGGGIVGTAAALELARGGLSVALFEAVAVGAGASGRNSGTVQHPFDDVLAPLHVRTVERYRVLAAEAPDQFDFPERPAGLLLLASDEEVATLDADARALREIAPFLEPTLVRATELRSLESSLAPDLAAVRLETAYPVPPAAAVQAFARLAEEAGVSFELGSACSLERDGDRAIGVRTADGVLHAAGSVLLAAGPAAADLARPDGAWRPIVRMWGVTVTVRLASPPHHVLEESDVGDINRPAAEDDAARASPRGDEGRAVDAATTGSSTGATEPRGHFPSTFSLVTARGRSVVGSTFLPQEPDPGSVGPLLLHRGDRFVPGLHNLPVDELRACARPQSLDGRPLVGRVAGDDNVFICAGHGPWGISTGPETARLVAELIVGRSPAIPQELDPGRFPFG